MVKPEPLVGLPALVKLPARVAVLRTSLLVKLPLLVRHTVPLVLHPRGLPPGDLHIKTVHSSAYRQLCCIAHVSLIFPNQLSHERCQFASHFSIPWNQQSTMLRQHRVLV